MDVTVSLLFGVFREIVGVESDPVPGAFDEGAPESTPLIEPGKASVGTKHEEQRKGCP